MPETFLHHILLGLLQGATEFLPISSSGHLVAARHLLGVRSPGLVLEVALHAGTLLAIIIAFRRDIFGLTRDFLLGVRILINRTDRREIARHAPLFPMTIAIIVGTIPAGLVGLLLRGRIADLFQGALWPIAAFLGVTGIILLLSRWAPDGSREVVGPLRGLLVGVAQAAALLPGISRSGVTIVAGRFLGIGREAAARFSFLLAIPAILGGALVEMLSAEVEGAGLGPGDLLAMCTGVIVAALTGWLCIIFLLRLVRRGHLHWFALYCLPAATALFLLS